MRRKMISPELIHHFRRLRKHQLDTYGNSGLFIDGKDAREFTGGGAAYGQHAYAAFLGAKRTIHFRRELSAKNKKTNERIAHRKAKQRAVK